MSEKNIKKGSVTAAALWDALCSKYILASLAAVAAALIAVLAGYESKYMLWETLAAFLLLTGTAAVQSSRLSSLGLIRRGMMKSKKSLDPRLIGSLEDISGIGSILGVLAGMSAAFAELFIIDGGILSKDNFALPMLTALAGSLSIGVSLAFLTSQTNSLRLLYLLSECASTEQGNTVKNAMRATHFPEIMKSFGRMCALRLTAAISLSIAVIMCSFCGTGSPYSCVGTALLTVLTLILTGIFPKFGRGEYTEEKLSVWTKSLRSFCTFSVIAFLLISFVFMFTFPIRSVYTNYTVRHDFDYDADISAEIDIISAPEANADTASLFMGFFAVSAIFIIVSAYSVSADDKTGISTNPVPYAVSSGAALLYVLLAGIIYPPCALDSVMWLVTVSFGSLILGINLIDKVVTVKKEKRAGK